MVFVFQFVMSWFSYYTFVTKFDTERKDFYSEYNVEPFVKLNFSVVFYVILVHIENYLEK